MIEAIKYNLANLTNFGGRDARPTFWWYVLFIVLLQFLIGLLASIPLMTASIGSAIDAVESGADQAEMQADMIASMTGAMDTTIWIGLFSELLVVGLLVASFVRRLHDSGNSGFWAIIPVITQLGAVFYAYSTMDQAKELMVMAADPSRMQEIEAVQAEMLANPLSWSSWIGLLVVVVFGVMKSSDGPNKYGETSVNVS